MLAAFGFGFLAAASLLVGAAIGIWARLPTRVIAWVMALGAGVLIASVAYDLIGEALRDDTHTEVMLGATAGALTFFVGDVLVSRGGADRRKTSTGHRRRRGGTRARRAAGRDPGVCRARGHDARDQHAQPGLPVRGRAVELPRGTLLCVGHADVGALASVDPHAVAGHLRGRRARRRGRVRGLGGVSVGTLAVVLSFAAGAIITMLASTMLPEAAAQGEGPGVGLAATAGFLLAVLLGG